MKVYLIIYEDVRPKRKRKKCILLGERREYRISRKTAEKFLPMMEQMTKPERMSKPFSSLKSFYLPKTGEEEKVLELFKRVLEEKRENIVKWWFMIYFPSNKRSS